MVYHIKPYGTIHQLFNSIITDIKRNYKPIKNKILIKNMVKLKINYIFQLLINRIEVIFIYE